MTAARGIHDHPTRKLGLRQPKNAPALLLADVLTGTIPDHPASADYLADVVFGLYRNNDFGDCGPVGTANYRRAIAHIVGAGPIPTQDDVFDLYRRSGNPTFDPATGTGDGGVDMQTMLEAVHAGGIGGVRCVAFAKVDPSNDDELDAATAIFGGLLWGVDLETAQQSQSGTWDYRRTGVWGGHAVYGGAYEAGQVLDVVSWADRFRTTPAFRRHQLGECWAVIWQEHLTHPAFLAGVDVAKLATAYKALTGSDLPDPGPAPVTPPDPQGPPPFSLGSALRRALTWLRGLLGLG